MFLDDESDDDTEFDEDGDGADEEDPNALRAELKACRQEIREMADVRSLRKWRVKFEQAADNEKLGAGRRMMCATLVDVVDDHITDLQAEVAAKKAATLLMPAQPMARPAASPGGSTARVLRAQAVALAQAWQRLESAEDRLPEETDVAALRLTRDLEYRRLVHGGPLDWWNVQRRVIERYDERIRALTAWWGSPSPKRPRSPVLQPRKATAKVRPPLPEIPAPVAVAAAEAAPLPSASREDVADTSASVSPLLHTRGTDRDGELLALVAKRGRTSCREAQAVLGWSRSTTRDVLARLVDTGKLLRTVEDPRSPLQGYILA